MNGFAELLQGLKNPADLGAAEKNYQQQGNGKYGKKHGAEVADRLQYF